MEKNIIGFDTVKLYWPGNSFYHLKGCLGEALSYDEVKKAFTFPFSGDLLTFTFREGMTSTLTFSIPKIYYVGDNTRLAGTYESTKVIESISNLLELDLAESKLSRLHITSNFRINYTPKKIWEALKPPPYFKGPIKKIAGEYFSLHADIGKSRKVLSIYSKNPNEVRFEFKFESKINSGEGIGKTIKKALKHDNNVSSLLKPTFYENGINYYTQILESTFRKKNQTEVDTQIISILKSELVENYNNSIV